MLANSLSEVRYAARRLLARPGYTAITIITLALGVGGTAAIFGIARRLLFGPLPYGHEHDVGVFWKKTDWTEEEFLHIRGRVPGFQQIALYRARDVILREGDAPARLLPGASASAELFDVLGTWPQMGPGFRRGDDVEGADRVAVLSHGLWQELGGEQNIMGTRLTIDGQPTTVVGVMPRGFWFPDPSVRIWTAERLSTEGRSWNSTLIGRVSRGQDVRALSGPVAQLVAMLDERFDYPAQWDKTVGAQITPIRDDFIGGMRPALYATLAAMALILLIACANVAALMLGQIDARATEHALRLALGAQPRRLTQALVVEAMLIAAAAGGFATALAWAGFRVLARALPLGAWADATAPDWTVFAAAMAFALMAALLVVIVPTISLRRGDLRDLLSRARTSGVGGRGGRLENGLVVGEVALAVLIATGAALLARSVSKLYALDPGVRTEGVGVIDITIGPGMNLERQRSTLEQLTLALRELPGVRAAGTVQTLPLRSGGYNLPIGIEGQPELQNQSTEYRMITPGYLEAMGIPLRDGRTIEASDRGDTERVVVINEALAREYFSNQNPIGRRVGGDIGSDARIIGVVGNAAERRLTDDVVPVRYVPIAQMPWIDPPQSLVIHATAGTNLPALLDAARRTVERMAPGVAVRAVTTMDRALDRAVGPARQVMTLLSLLTGLALILGAVGIYGVIAHFAARRRRDWAIRIALGLPGSRVIAHVVGHGALLMAVGIGIGVLAAAALARLLATLLYGVSAIDPLAFGAAGAVLLAVGLVAALGPAVRAGMTDPAVVLREQ